MTKSVSFSCLAMCHPPWGSSTSDHRRDRRERRHRPPWMGSARLIPRGGSGTWRHFVGSAGMAAAHADSAVKVAVAVLVTLVIYWVAERYSRLVAGRIHDGRRPSWGQVRRQLTAGWELVTASTLPLAALVTLSLVGVGLDASVLSALATSTVLLCVAGWQMGRNGQLSGPERITSSAVAGAFGVVMILLKALLH